MRLLRIMMLSIFFLLSAFAGIESGEAKVLEVFYCSGVKIQKNDSTYMVLKYCGEPIYKEVISAEGCDKVEKWHYDCKGRSHVEELTFIKGVLSDRSEGEKTNGVQLCGETEDETR